MQKKFAYGGKDVKNFMNFLKELFVICFHEKASNASVNHNVCSVKGKKHVIAKYTTYQNCSFIWHV